MTLCGGPEGGERQVVVVLDELDLHRHADLDLLRIDADEGRPEPRALRHLEEAHRQRIVERRYLRIVVHHEAVDAGLAARFHGVPVIGAAVRARGTRRMSQRAALRTALDQQLVLLRAFEEERVVLCDRGTRPPWPLRGRPGGRALRGGPAGSRLVLYDPGPPGGGAPL